MTRQISSVWILVACEQAPSEPARSEKNSASEERDSASEARVPLTLLTESCSSLAEFFFQTSLGACSQARILEYHIPVHIQYKHCLSFLYPTRYTVFELTLGYIFKYSALLLHVA